ncbi:MAG TPA: hypothetical protein VK666_13080 [Chryseolinea sp.]|nr:hypothetical protein [Chryseolinea sp.]
MTTTNRHTVSTGNALPQVAVKMLKAHVLQSVNNTIIPTLEVRTVKGAMLHMDETYYVIPVSALTVSVDKFLNVTKSMMTPFTFRGFIFE